MTDWALVLGWGTPIGIDVAAVAAEDEDTAVGFALARRRNALLGTLTDLFVTRDAQAWDDVTPRHLLFRVDDVAFADAYVKGVRYYRERGLKNDEIAKKGDFRHQDSLKVIYAGTVHAWQSPKQPLYGPLSSGCA